MLDCHKLVLLCCTNCTEFVLCSLHGLNLFLFMPFIWNVTINVSVVSITINLTGYRKPLYLSVLFVLEHFSLIVNVVQKLVNICIDVPLINLNE